MFLKLKDLTGSPAFQESDATKDGWITPKEFREKMEAFKSYSPYAKLLKLELKKKLN